MFTVIRTLPCRRNVTTLLEDEFSALRGAFIDALKQLKADGDYDPYVVTHQNAMDRSTPPSVDSRVRNAAHRGPAFLPWHREFLIRLEQDLRAIEPSVALPYWDWAADADLADPAAGGVWSNQLLGGDGDESDGDIVKTGPFREGEWQTVDSSGSPAGALRRQFARSGDAIATGWTSLPQQAHIDTALGRTPYDSDPWHRSSDPSFRNELEGWIADGLHNRVHVFVGGDMLPGTSPNDPVFFLHHCFVDKIWADWQALHPAEMYLPQTGGPPGHNVSDALFPWSTTPADVLNHQDYYLYDTDPPIIEKLTASVEFTDVPEGETTYRAIVFKVTTAQVLNLEIAAPGPGPDFGTYDASVTIDPGLDGVVGEARLWITYTGTSDGDEAYGTVVVRAIETGQEWTLDISANTIRRKSVAAVMALDKSGSMDAASGIPGKKRIDILHYSATPFANLIQEGNAIGIISFDHDAYPVMPVTGPLSAPGPFEIVRPTAINHIRDHETNPAGYTAIGDALELAHSQLASESYEVKAIIVLTDGYETASKRISEVADSITDEHVYAIGLGTPEQIQPSALNALTNGSGGYMFLTGELNDDLYFRLTKYYLQILAGVSNEDIVTDPQGWVGPKQVHRIPFELNETDISSDVILLASPPWAVDFWVETPQGDRIDPSVATGLPGVNFVSGRSSAYYRMTLPVPWGEAGAREGKWHAVLCVNEDNFREYLGTLENQPEEQRKARIHGIRYSLNVHAYSNLRLRARVSQDSHEPGATVFLSAVLTEYGMPVNDRASVVAQVQRPNGTAFELVLNEVEPGLFEADFPATLSGVYACRVMADGRTLRGRAFTREQSLTGFVWQGGDDPIPTWEPGDGDRDERWCRLLACLISAKGFDRFLERQGLEPEMVRRCLKAYCAGTTVGSSRPDIKRAIDTAAILRNPRLNDALTRFVRALVDDYDS